MTTEKNYTPSELERYLVGELDDARRAAIEQAAAEDPELKTWIDQRRAEQHAFLVDPRRKTFAKLLAEANEPKVRVRWWTGLSVVAVAAAAAILFVRPPAEQPTGVRTKGGMSLQAAVLDGDQLQLFEGERLHPGSRLRLSVDDPRGGFVTVILEEASGGISVLYGPDELGRLGPGTHRLPGSLELDGTLGRERLYVLMSDDQPKVDVWVKELESAHRKTGFLHGWLPEGTTRVSTLEYEKIE